MSGSNNSDKITSKSENSSYYFDRVFEFQKNSKWTLPQKPFSSSKFEVPELQDMKYQLNQVKGLLGQFNLDEWSKHTRNRDVSSFIMDYLKRNVRPELMTQAWCKFYEILFRFPLVPDHKKKRECFLSLHLCEAPGAFVCALNHYLAQNRPNLEWDWLANTLNPDYEGTPLSIMIPDDRLIKHTRNKWYFGLDATGDIQKYYNHTDLVAKVNTRGKVKLVTADGSVDCMVDPGEQERLTEFLHYCETMTALAVLQTGGSFVLKIFTIFEDTTICLLYLLNCVFEKVSVFKPCSSKSGNSEVYIVCNDYLGFELIESIWDQLLIPYKMGNSDKNHSMFSMSDIPYSFNLQVLSCCSDFFAERQINAIKDNIYHFQNAGEETESELNSRKMATAKLYVKKYKLNPILKKRKLVPYANIHRRSEMYYFEDDTLSDNFCLVYSLFKSCLLLNEDTLNIQFGKRIDVVYTSQFTSVENLEYYKTICYNERSSNSLYLLTVEKFKKNNTIVINLNDFDLRVYYKYQKDLFMKIFNSVKDENISNIIFVNIPFYTYFLAGLYCVLAHGFTEIYYNCGKTVFLGAKKEKMARVRNLLNVIHEHYGCLKNNQFHSDIIQLVPKYVFEYTPVTSMLHMNNNLLKKE